MESIGKRKETVDRNAFFKELGVEFVADPKAPPFIL
jgi:hypothetical protein